MHALTSQCHRCGSGKMGFAQSSRTYLLRLADLLASIAASIAEPDHRVVDALKKAWRTVVLYASVTDLEPLR